MKRFWEFQAVAGDPTTGELSIYGPIGSDGDGMSWLFDEVTPAQFKADLDELGPIATLNVTINSPGGDVFAGQAIHTMLARHRAHVNMYVDGLAASIASLIVMAGDTVIMPKNAMLMVHDPFTIAMGNARDMRKLADTLDTVRESMIAAYQSKTALPHDDLVSLLEAETWMTASQAVAQGFADEIEASKAIAASMVRPGVAAFNGREFDLTHFKHPPVLGELREEAPRTDPLTIRDAERALVTGGFPRSLAKRIVTHGYKADGETPEPSDETTESGTLLATVEEGPRLNHLRLSYTRSLIAGSLAGAARSN